MGQVWGKTSTAVLVGIALGLSGCGSGSSDDAVVVQPKTVVTGQLTFNDDAKGFKTTFAPASDLSGVELSAKNNDPIETVKFISADGKDNVKFSLNLRFSVFDLQDFSGYLKDFTPFLIENNDKEHSIKFDIKSLQGTFFSGSVTEQILFSLLGISTPPSKKELSPIVNGSLAINYDPNLFVMNKSRFPIKKVDGSFSVEGQTYKAETVSFGEYVGGLPSLVFAPASSQAVSFKVLTNGTDYNNADLFVGSADDGVHYICNQPCHIISKIENGIQNFAINSTFYKLDVKSNVKTDGFNVIANINNPVASGSVDIIQSNQKNSLMPTSYYLSAINNQAIYTFTSGQRVMGNIPSTASTVEIVVEKNIINNLSYTVSKNDGTAQEYACSTKSANPCSGITLYPDGKTFNFKQAKLSGGVVLTGTLKHAGA